MNLKTEELADFVLAGGKLRGAEALAVLEGDTHDILPLVLCAGRIRQRYWGRGVRIHILDNVQNGRCTEDCAYCVQSRRSKSQEIVEYPMKSRGQILAEAENAARAGAYRHCMVFSGRGPAPKRTTELCEIVREIKSRFAMEVCVSPGTLDEDQARRLREAGLDRLNHNINTTEEHHGLICTTHSYQDRLNTLFAARKAGLKICSGFITGMGEGPAGIVKILGTLAEVGVDSIPVNFLLPLSGIAVEPEARLSPQYALRVLCLARLMNPEVEIRIGAGREHHLRGLQSLALYPANSLFADGYLNSGGESVADTQRMITDAGFEVDEPAPRS
ncbi:MAG: biotin synthase BioB [Planctomycetes bacterium]|nr:biotin synthase BioB [Planctomycetota bacterium]